MIPVVMSELPMRVYPPGQAHGISCADNVIKECEEEASIPAQLAQKAKPVGAISFHALYANGLKRDVLFCYDLQLPADFEPKPEVCLFLTDCTSYMSSVLHPLLVCSSCWLAYSNAQRKGFLSSMISCLVGLQANSA